MIYKHTQIGYLIIFILLVTVLYFGIIFTYAESSLIAVIVMILILILLASFATLNVLIDENYLQIKFGYGIFKKHFILKEIISVRIVKNHWYYGWGIRLWWWPRMVIYNISGFDAVEIKIKNGKIYRIGTDEPEKLEYAIAQVINKNRF
ncbi:hypothetical protein ACFLYY_01975 [Patescibacteria group bacterium]